MITLLITFGYMLLGIFIHSVLLGKRHITELDFNKFWQGSGGAIIWSIILSFLFAIGLTFTPDFAKIFTYVGVDITSDGVATPYSKVLLGFGLLFVARDMQKTNSNLK